MNKNVGLWISNKKAVLVITIHSKINIHNVVVKNREPSKSRNPRFLETNCNTIPRKTNTHLLQQEDYFKHIINYLAGAKRILIVGPDGASESFYKYLRNSNKSICNCVCNVRYLDFLPDSRIANHFIRFFRIKNEKRKFSSY